MDVQEFWKIAARGRKHEGGPLIRGVEAALEGLSPQDRRDFHTWVVDVDKRMRTRAHHEVAALCFSARATRDFDLLRTWWIMQGPRFVDTIAGNPQTAADLRDAEMQADVGESLPRAVGTLCGIDVEAEDHHQVWPAVTTPLTGLAARYPRAASALERSQGPLWSAADLLRHTGRPVDSLQHLVDAFRRVADGGEREAIGQWGVIEGRARPSRLTVDESGRESHIPPALFVYFRPSKAFAAALAGEEAPAVDVPRANLFAAMLDLGEEQLRVELPHCVLLRVYTAGEGEDRRRLIRTRPAPELFERANRTAHATDPGAGRRLFTPTPAGAPARTEGLLGQVKSLFGL